MAKKRKRRNGRTSHYITGIHVSPKAGECKYRSSWELAYHQYLDMNPDVMTYQYEGIMIPYLKNARSSKVSNYYPDFLVEYVNGDRKLVEIKPLKRLEQLVVKKKLEAARQWCSEHDAALEIITENELRAIGAMK